MFSLIRSVKQKAALFASLAMAMLAAGSAFSLAPSSSLARGPVSVAPVAEQLVDAVVNISSSQHAKGPQGTPLPNVPKGAPFEDFFDEFFDQRGGSPGLQRKVSSLGSGFVIDGKEGLIVTNNHVISDADEIIINFADGSTLTVEEIVGRDDKTDLALLRVKPKKPLVDVKFGTSRGLRVGDWVMAIGNPFGLGGSVTVGIISAKQRNINTGPYDDYLQTDAAINKGNSGGPLFNMDGEVIGVNTAIFSPTGGSVGIGFAVPSDVAMTVIDQLRQFGETRRGWLGVRIQSVSEEIAASLGVAPNSGALVAGVEDQSPAAKAGIAPGDVILRFDDKPVTTMRSLPKIVAQSPIGKTVKVEVVRNGEPQTFDVEVARLDEGGEGQRAPSSVEIDPSGIIPGATLAEISEKVRSEFGLKPDTKGVVVLSVKPDGTAAKKGIAKGDVIVEVAQTAVTTLKDVADAVDKIKNSTRRAVLVRVEQKSGGMRFIAIPLR